MASSRSSWTLWLIPLCILGVALAAFIVYRITTRGVVRVSTLPAGATVTANGTSVGVTPDSALVFVVDPGPVAFVIEKAGYEPVRLSAEVRRGERFEIDQVLHPPGMVYVRGGAFEMGTDEGAFAERPAHTVTLSPFYVDRTEVTVSAYRLHDPGYRPAFPGDDLPATNISWAEADGFCRVLGKRLPTEAEWERTCSGPEGEAYSYGGTFDPSRGRSAGDLEDGPVPVGSYRPGNAGALDMTGNVWEWCSDWYDRDTYRDGGGTDPEGPSSGTRHVLRGGAWFSNAEFSKCSHRPGNIRSLRDPSFGFRCARSLN